MSYDWTQATEKDLKDEARMYVGNIYSPGEEGYCPVSKAQWSYQPEFSMNYLEHLMDLGQAQWIEWFDDEHQMFSEDGREWVCNDMMSQDIVEPIVVILRDGKAYIWDGWHRTGATFKKNLTTIKAIVGIPQVAQY